MDEIRDQLMTDDHKLTLFRIANILHEDIPDSVKIERIKNAVN